MKTTDFDYDLPQERIAQTPAEPRDSSRLLVYNRATGEKEHRIFHDLPQYLRKGDLLVINQTKVIPARIFGTKETGGQVEVLLLRRVDENLWETLVGGKRLFTGKTIRFSDSLSAEIVDQYEGSRRLLRFDGDLDSFVVSTGQMPLPPYIHTRLEDPNRYQTVYAKDSGSAAAPTAGLHFTERLMNELKEMGVQFAGVTLHVGLDTFAPVTEDDPEEHHIHTEWCEVSEETARLINETVSNKGRVIAVGTTSARTLETAAQAAVQAGSADRVIPFCGQTSIFILPGYEFKGIDAIITNFHLPKSTLIMMISAFAGRENVLEIYKEAIDMKYRFFSFGDAMLIL